jgi:membrane associated rhomboid family serine protease
VTHFLFLVLIIIGVALYFMTPAERTRVLQILVAASHKAKEMITLEGLQSGPFFDALRARTPRIVATPSLIALSATIFMFVRSPALDLFISAVCLWQIGLILERLVGRLAFTTVYVASGIAAGVASLSVSPGGMRVAASASVLGIYGLLLVTSIGNMIRGSDLTIPLKVTKQLAPVAAVFVLYKMMTTGLWHVPELAALVCGLVGGVVVARDINARTPQIRRLATAMAAVVTVVTLYAATVVYRPVHESMDVRPEIERVITVEDRTAGLYEKEVDRFRKGRITAAALADVIERAIVPELRAVAGRLRTLQDVPPEHQGLIATAETFLKLRDEAWRLRAAALHKSDMRALRQADTKEQASREAFLRLKVPLTQDSSGQPSS